MLAPKLRSHCSTAQKKHSTAPLSTAVDRKSSFSGSETSSDDSCGLFQQQKAGANRRGTNLSAHSNSTEESNFAVPERSACLNAIRKLEGIESEYNHLIQQNDTKTSGHFSILNENIRALLGKRRDSALLDSLVIPNTPTFDGNLREEVSVGDLSRLLKNSSPSFAPTSLYAYETPRYENSLFDRPEQSTQQTTTHRMPLDQSAAVIPDKFRAKKLPHLDKKIRTGYVKFFDDKNNFGFMNLTVEPFGEVFVFGREFEKANIGPDVVALASNNAEVTFKFRVMYYMGKHGESKKAVNIRLSNC